MEHSLQILKQYVQLPHTRNAKATARFGCKKVKVDVKESMNRRICGKYPYLCAQWTQEGENDKKYATPKAFSLSLSHDLRLPKDKFAPVNL